MIRPPPSSPLFPSTPLSRSPRQGPPQIARPSATYRSARPARASVAAGSVILTTTSRPPHCRRPPAAYRPAGPRSEEHTSELQSQSNLVCRLLLEKKKHDARFTSMGFDLLHTRTTRPSTLEPVCISRPLAVGNPVTTDRELLVAYYATVMNALKSR